MCLMTRMAGRRRDRPGQLTARSSRGAASATSTSASSATGCPGYEGAVLVSTSPAVGRAREPAGHRRARADGRRGAGGRPFADQIGPLRGAGRGPPLSARTRAGRTCRGRHLRHPLPSLLPRRAGTGSWSPAACFSRHARRPRLRPHDGDVHGDGPGGRDRRGAGGGRRLGAGVRSTGARCASGWRPTARTWGCDGGRGRLPWRRRRVVAVLRAAREPAQVIEVVVAGGIRVVEITLDSPDAEAVIAAARARHPGVLVGAGRCARRRTSTARWAPARRSAWRRPRCRRRSHARRRAECR